jgi:hypothetical protein
VLNQNNNIKSQANPIFFIYKQKGPPTTNNY